MDKYPDVRRLERDTLIEQIDWGENYKVADIQSAAGYVSDRVYELQNRLVTCYCIEPCEALRSRLKPIHHPISDPVESFPSIADGTMDVVLGLAALHHSSDHLATLCEARRVLTTGGQIAICDVMVGSNIAAWLNEFVDRYSPSGHQGRFIEEGKVVEDTKRAGFVEVKASVRLVPWIFTSEEDIPVFFRGLFNVQCTDAELREALQHYFEIKRKGGRVEIPWELLYLTGLVE